MKRKALTKNHKWAGIIVSLFLLVFCLTGIILNHRSAFRNVNVSRSLLPSRYSYHNWNGGLFRGSIPLDSSAVLIYGNSGIWLTDRHASSFADFNKGLPQSADCRQIRNICRTADGSLFAVSPFGLYRLNRGSRTWTEVSLPVNEDETLADVQPHGDALVVLSRSFAYVGNSSDCHFQRIAFPAPPHYDRHVSLFRTVWLLHSGALFGTVGKIIVDAVAVVFILLLFTGLLLWLKPVKKLGNVFRLHDKAGTITIVLTLLVVITGWFLRPPGLALIARGTVPAVPGSVLDSDNPWNDKLRMLRYDSIHGDWLLSTTEGFYHFRGGSFRTVGRGGSLRTVAIEKVGSAPPTSVMGLTVLKQDSLGRWLCGSMGGLLVWNRERGTVVDAFTGKAPVPSKGSPIGSHAVVGYSSDFSSPIVVDYTTGTTSFPQPEWMDDLPMSLWNVALELHSGRIYAGNLGSFLFIFLIGLFIAWCLWTGFRIRK